MATIDDTVRQHKFTLEESEMPTAWYNIVPDLPSPPPPALHPARSSRRPRGLRPALPMDLILQEVSTDSYIDIPGGVLDVYRQWRPSPLFRAHRLEAPSARRRASITSTRGLAGRLAQAQHGRAPGVLQRQGRVRRLTTETGAGQWGTALAFACALYGLDARCGRWVPPTTRSPTAAS